jgi:N-acetylmuramoyl-L-alanine amidase
MQAIDINHYRTTSGYNKRVRFLVLHYTAANFAQSVMALTRGQTSAHYLVPAQSDQSYIDAGFSSTRIFNLVNEHDRAWHAGVSNWAGRDNLNDTSIGIEIVNQASETGGVFTFPDFEPEQIEAVRELAVNILLRYPDISPKNVVGHADIAYMRKSDPGPKLPWKKLAQAGIGAWYEEASKQDFIQRFERQGLPPRTDIIAAFRQYGYARPEDSDRAFGLLTRAFQMHFRPESYNGIMDAETCAILYALNVRYPS